MKKLSKITTLLLSMLLMMSAFAACSGGNSDANSEEATKEAEPNMGNGRIVFAVPEDWELTDAYETGATYYNEDKKFIFWAGMTTEESLKEAKEYNEKIKATTVPEYYEELSSDKEALKKVNAETNATKVGEWDATETKTTNEKGECVGIGVRWLYDGVMYMLDLSSTDLYDDTDKFNKKATALSEELLAAYESIVASVKEGDGDALKWANVDDSSNGDFTYEAPEGYKLENYSDGYVTYVKEGSKISISMSKTTEEDLENMTDENGNAPASLKEAFNNNLHEGVETTTIAGCEGYKFLDNEYMDGKTYFCEAGFLAEDGIYNIHIGSDAWDEDGELRENAEALTDEDKATFEKFIESIKKK